MIHLTNITWAQIALVNIGAMFQLAALGAFVRDTKEVELPHEIDSQKEAEQAHEEESRCHLPEEKREPKVVFYHREIEGIMEDVPADIRPGDLLRTAKVSFKQHLKARKDDPQYTPTVHW